VEVGGGDIDGLLDRLGDVPIVLLLQEVYRSGVAVPPIGNGAHVPGRIAPLPPSGVRRSIADVAARRGLSLVYVPSMRNGRRGSNAEAEDRGNAILSTLPLLDPSAIELPFEHQRRVAVAASVQVAGGAGRPSAIRVVSVHLDTRSSWRRGAFLWFGRMRQAGALAGALHGGAPTILGGDFNSWLGELEPDVRRTRRLFPQTPVANAHVTFPVFGRLGFHLDHLFFSLPNGWRGEVSRLDERWGSDHYPIVGSASRASADTRSP
jgi:endonuclease/exonuclease/phosphatase family metal-dependent hydrolase